jgi:uncharacterized protein YndB with AHSA1/START domain
MNEVEDAKTATLRLEFPIEAPVERVWEAILNETSRWWDQEFVALPGSKGVTLEPRLGGRLYEQTEDGRGLVWAQVIGIDPGRSIDFLGVMTPAFSGPTTTMVQLAIETSEGGTVLRLTEGLVGRVTDEVVANMTAGWTFLMGTKLKGYVEGGA